MSTSNALVASQTQVLIGDVLGTTRVERWRKAGLWAVQAMDEARSHVMNLTEAVITMDMDKSQYRREVNGLGHFSLLRLGMLPETFWRAFFYRIGERFNWNMAVMQSVTREETAEEELDRHLVTDGAELHGGAAVCQEGSGPVKGVALTLVVVAFVLVALVFGLAIKVAAWNECRSLGGPVAHCWQVVQR